MLVVITAFVGTMVGLERAVLPLLAEQDFGVQSRTAILSFIASFGLTKALSNLFAGRFADRFARKPILVAGWLVAVPVPLLIFWAPSWTWIVGANLLLGVNQGLAWSSTVVMKIDLVGPERRGFAMGLNEASGYLAVGISALVSGSLAATYGIRSFLVAGGLGCAVAGLLLSFFATAETTPYAELESSRLYGSDRYSQARNYSSKSTTSFANILLLTSWKDRTLFSVSQAGLVNNVNDGMAWGLFPLLFATRGYSLSEIGALSAIYPAVWGLGQLLTGAWSDRIGRKPLIAGGMLLQAVAIVSMLIGSGIAWTAAALALLGVGTACVYPTLLAAVGDVAHPAWRATSIGVYRLWRDGGYVAGALAVGVLADVAGTSSAIGFVAALTAVSGLLAAVFMRETVRRPQHDQAKPF